MKTVSNFTATMLVLAAVVMNLKTGGFIFPVMLGLAAYYLADYAKRSCGLYHLRSRQTEEPGPQNYFENVSSTAQTRRNEAAA